MNQKVEIHVTGAEIEVAKLLWIKEVKRKMKSKEKFKMRSHQLGLFKDDKGVIRCQGRLGNRELAGSVSNLA